MPSLDKCRHVEAVVLHAGMPTRAEWCPNCGATRIYPAAGRLGHWKKPTYNNLANRINDVKDHYEEQTMFPHWCAGAAAGLGKAMNLVWGKSVKSQKEK